MNVEKISISFPKFLLKEIDELVKKKGYSSRSEVIRDAIRKYVLESNTLDKDYISGIIIVVYTPDKDVLEYMSKLYFKYNDIVKSLSQSYITTSCKKVKKVEIFVVEGEGKKVKEFYENINKLPKKIYDKIIIF
ncbi:CopG family ribbon-helix-helix protein [Methanocaldococcus sp.]